MAGYLRIQCFKYINFKMFRLAIKPGGIIEQLELKYLFLLSINKH